MTDAALERDLHALLAGLASLTPGGPRTAARPAEFAAAARRADAGNRPDLASQARWGLLGAAMVSGPTGDGFVLPTFARLLADHDRATGAGRETAGPLVDPDGDGPAEGWELNPGLLLAAYADVLRYATGDPGVPRERIAELLADFSRRTAAAGGDPVLDAETRMHVALDLGDLEEAPPLFERACAARAAGASLSRAGGTRRPSPLAEARLASAVGWPGRALAVMLPVLDGRGVGGRGVIEAGTNGWGGDAAYKAAFRTRVLRPLVRVGREDEAITHYGPVRRGAGLTDDERVAVLEFAARRRDLPAVARGVAFLLPRSARMGPESRLWTLHACGLACGVLDEAGDRPRRFDLPADLPDRPEPDADGAFLPSDLAAPLTAAAEVVAARFDARDGRDRCARGLAADRAFIEDPRETGEPIDRLPSARRAALRELWNACAAPGGGP